MRLSKTFASIVFMPMVCSCFFAKAQDTGDFTITASMYKVCLTDELQITVKAVKGTQELASIKPDMGGMKIISGPTQSQTSSTSIIGGKTTSTSAIIMKYTVRALKTGYYDLTAKLKTKDGVEVSAKPIKIEVVQDCNNRINQPIEPEFGGFSDFFGGFSDFEYDELSKKIEGQKLPYFVVAGSVHHNHNLSDSLRLIFAVNEIDNVLRTPKKAHPLGIYRYNGEVNTYFLVADTLGLRSQIEDLYKKYSGAAEFETLITEKDNWNKDKGLTGRANMIQDWKDVYFITDQVVKQGGDLSLRRRIYLKLRFKKKDGRAQFHKLMVSKGYEAVDSTSENNELGNYDLFISCVTTLVPGDFFSFMHTVKAEMRGRCGDQCEFLGIDKIERREEKSHLDHR